MRSTDSVAASLAGSRGRSNDARPRFVPVDWTRQETSPIFSSSANVRSPPPSSAPSKTAVPTVGCPANGNSRAGVKILTFARDDRFAGGQTNTVSERLNSRAIASIAGVSSPSGSSTTASGFPVKAWSVKTSSVANRRFIRRWYRGSGRSAGHCLHTRDAARSGGVETCRRADSQIGHVISRDFKTVCSSASPVSVSIARNSTSGAIARCARQNATRSYPTGCRRRSVAAGAGPVRDPIRRRPAYSPE